jgi:hypothetical protein
VPVLQPQRSARALREEKPPQKDQPNNKDPAAAITSACRTPREQQRTQCQEVAVEHPLLIGQAGVQLSPDGRDRDVDHGAIQQCHPRTNDGRGNQPPRTRRRQRQLAWLDIFAARGLVYA